MSSSFLLILVVCPSGVLVVAGAGFQAAVQDADQPVGELAQRGVVGLAPGAELVVVGTGPSDDLSMRTTCSVSVNGLPADTGVKASLSVMDVPS